MWNPLLIMVHPFVDIAYKIKHKDHSCSTNCVKKLKPFIEELENLAKLRTTVGRNKRFFIDKILPNNKKGDYLRSLLRIAYISDQVLRRQSKTIHKRNSRYRAMAERLLLVSPDFLTQMVKNFSTKNNNPMDVNSQLSLPPHQNLQLASEQGKKLSEMEMGTIPYDDKQYNKNLSQHIGNLQTYKRKMVNLPPEPEEISTNSANSAAVQPTAIPQVSSVEIQNKLKGSVPRTYLRHAENVFDIIKNSNGRISVDADNGVTIDGSKIAGSNVIDLVSYLVGRKKRNPKLPGLSSFVSVLRELGIPKTLINDPSRLDILESGIVPASLDPTVQGNKKYDDSFRTPVRVKRPSGRHQTDPDPLDPLDVSPQSLKKIGKKKNKTSRGKIGKGMRKTASTVKQLSKIESVEFSKWLKRTKKTRGKY